MNVTNRFLIKTPSCFSGVKVVEPGDTITKEDYKYARFGNGIKNKYLYRNFNKLNLNLPEKIEVSGFNYFKGLVSFIYMGYRCVVPREDFTEINNTK